MSHVEERIQIWNILHDGEITAIEGEGSDRVTMFINIPYLRRRLKPLGDSFVLTLEGVTDFGFIDFDGEKSRLCDEIEIGSVEILSTDSETMPISIFTTMGQLIMDYKQIHFLLDTGQEVDFKTIYKVCKEYWDEFKAKSKPKS
jgi:hypothetical protein